MARNYRVLLDWDQDGYFCRFASPGDAPNLIEGGARHKGLCHAKYATQVTAYARRLEETLYGLYIYAASKGGGAGSNGVMFGANTDLTGMNSIPLKPSQNYYAKAWVKVLSGSTSVTIEAKRSTGITLATATTTVTTGVWTPVSVPFTNPGISPAPYIGIGIKQGAGAGSIEVAGLMLVEGSTIPTNFNTGAASLYENITADVRDTLSFNDGLPYDDDFCQPSQLALGLRNDEGFWNPSNTLSPVYGKFRQGTLIRVEADDGSAIYPLWHGTTERFTYYNEDGINRYALLEASDGALKLTDSEYAPRFLENVRTDVALKDVFASGAFCYPYTGAFGLLDAPGFSELDKNFVLFEERVTDFCAGDTVLPFAGDNIDRGDGTNAQMYLREILATELGGRFFWDAVTAKYVFHNRLRDATAALTEWTPGAALDYPPPAWSWGGDVINHVDLLYEVRQIGSPGTVVYTFDNLPLALAAGATRTISARYTSTSIEQQIAVKDGITPVEGTDYDGNYTDGGMENARRVLNLYVEWAANTASIRIVNSSARPVQVTTLRLRGTPVITTKAQSVMARDPESIGLHGLHKQSLNIRSINGETFAQQYADVRAHQQSHPIKQLRTLAFRASSDPANEAMILGARVGDLLNADAGDGAQLYIILARNHQIEVETNDHIAEYTVKAIVRSAVLILNSPLRGLIDAGVIGL